MSRGAPLNQSFGNFWSCKRAARWKEWCLTTKHLRKSSFQSEQEMASTSSNPHLSLDAGLLLSTDASSLDAKRYADEGAREELIQARVLASTKALLSHLYSLPITQDPDNGPLAALPAPSYPLLPREKALPKPKAETKWEAFAKRKGIQHRKKDKLVWDEEAKEWVPSWGFKGKNKKEEEQWIHELPASAGDDFNPVASLRKERKEKSLHNKGQQLKNMARANATAGKPTESALATSSLAPKPSAGGRGAGEGAPKKRAEREHKIAELDAEVKRGRASTASMGRFDKKLEGEGKEKGLKRKVSVKGGRGLLEDGCADSAPFLISLRQTKWMANRSGTRI